MLQYFETFLPLVKSFDLLNKVRYILWVVALLEDCDVTKNGRHLGRRLEFYQEVEIRLKPREMVLSSKSQFDPIRKRSQPLRECGVLSLSLRDHAMEKKVKLDESPLLFVLFVNDMPIVLERCQILMYADDTVMYISPLVMPKKSVVLLPVDLPRLMTGL